MVYESDFYTTRRPYSSRPHVSSYSVTPMQGPFYLYNPYSSYEFDDEARDIRARTDNLLRRIHVFVPRPSTSDYDETSPERLRSDDYVRRIINAKNTRKEIESLPWYTTPEKRDIGQGHLACVKYAGGRPQSRRRPYYTVGDLVPGDVKSDVNLMSYYMKNRKAAEDALKKQPDEETIKKVQEYLAKKAEEKKKEEEKRAWELEEHKRMVEEKELARLAKLKLEHDEEVAKMKEIERLEAERLAVIKRAEDAKAEAERLVEDEKLYNEAVAQAIADEEERVAKEKEREERKKQDDEEDKVANLSLSSPGVGNDIVTDELHLEEHSLHADLSDQDQEAKPYEVDHDEDTQVEEDVHEELDDLENPFVDGGAAKSTDIEETIVDAPQIKERGCTSDDQGFNWSEYESEPEVEEACYETKAEEVVTEQQQTFEETEVDSQADCEEVQVEETESSQIDDAVVEDEETEQVVQEQDEEAKSDERSDEDEQDEE